MTSTLETNVGQAWNEALQSWNHPSIPRIIVAETPDQINELGEIGQVLHKELAFMKFPEFQTYANIANITEQFGEDPQRGTKAVFKHEVGHRFMPYDTITKIILDHHVAEELKGQKLPYDAKSAAGTIINLFSDMCVNTRASRGGDEDIPWAYQQISKKKEKEKLWRVYARSMELAWDKKILPEGIKLKKDETKGAEELAGLFKGDFFDKRKWPENARKYAGIISKFLENKEKDRNSSFDPSSGDVQETINDATAKELAKRLAEIGSNGLPTNPNGLKEFKGIMAGYGQGDPKKASIMFYDKLSDSYDVMFATRPFGRPRVNPFQPIKWQPSMGADTLDIQYSAQVGGRVIPGVNTYAWNTRRRDVRGGFEEVIPNLDIYLDSSQSMTNPIENISLPVLAAFVAAKKAHRKGASVRSTNFSGDRQSVTQEFTRDLYKVFENLVTYYNGGTVFPSDKLLAAQDPKQVAIITDTFLGNTDQTIEAVVQLKKRHKGNNVTIYALHPVPNVDAFREAGAQIIHGTTTDIFKQVIGRASQVYST